MKRTDTFFLLLLGLVPSLACATTLPPPAREAPDLCVIAISVSISAPLWGHTQAEYVYFVRLDDSETYGHYRPIRSNYTSGKYVYLFNARPGRYAVVAAGYVRQTQGAPVGTSVGVGGGFSVGRRRQRFATSASISSGSFGIAAVRFSWPFRVIATSSSIRTPMPRKRSSRIS